MTFVRQDIWDLEDQQSWHPVTLAYAHAVAALRALPAADPTSWSYQGAIHGSTVTPALADWNQCQHGSWYFLPWHRWYIYYFERMVRAVVISQGGPADWALPYWNYDGGGTKNTLPLPFRQKKLPNSNVNNPLYLSHRKTPINAGAGIPAMITSPSIALSKTGFSPPPSPGFGGGQSTFQHFFNLTGALEQTPHNDIHNAIGGWMADPNRAALDPIFWLHHANIDRLWDKWNASGRSNPAASNWLNQKFTYFNENGATVTKKVSGANSVTALGYRYAPSGQPPTPHAVPVAAVAAAGVSPGSPGSPPAGRGPAGEPELVGATGSGVRLAGARSTVTVPLDARTRARRNNAALAASGDGVQRVYLNLDNVDADSNPEAVYAVYIEGSGPAVLARTHVGNLSLFGIEKMHANTDTDAPHDNRFVYDITDLIGDTPASVLTHESIDVTFDPITLEDGPSGKPPAPQTHPAITVGRVSISVE